jgi:hypothetical protein
MTRSRSPLCCCAVIVTGAMAASAPAEQLINGGFEQPAVATFVTVTAPDAATIPGWNVIGGTVDIANAAGNGFITGPAFGGAQYLDLNGTSAGDIRQTFPTSPGVKYTLSFAYANNYVNAPSQSATLGLADGANTFINTAITHSTSVAGNLDWTLFTQDFTAQQATTTLSFTSLISGSGGVLLDGASVTVAPEPIAAMAMGSIALLAGLRSRKAHQR